MTSLLPQQGPGKPSKLVHPGLEIRVFGVVVFFNVYYYLYGLVLLTGATTRHWGDSQIYADFMPFILKANPIWFWFSLWGDCLLFLERGDPYFICHTSCREAVAISQCRC